MREGAGSAASAAAGQDSGKDSGGGEGADGKAVDMVSCIVKPVSSTFSRCHAVLALYFQPIAFLVWRADGHGASAFLYLCVEDDRRFWAVGTFRKRRDRFS